MILFDDLPNEILLVIFALLPQKKPLTLACQRWNSLVSDHLHLKIDLTDRDALEPFLAMRFERAYRRLSISVVGILVLSGEWNVVDPLAILLKCQQLVQLCEPKLLHLKLVFDNDSCHTLFKLLPRRVIDPVRLKSLEVSLEPYKLLERCSERGDPGSVRRMKQWVAQGDAEIVAMPNLQSIGFDCSCEVKLQDGCVDGVVRRFLGTELLQKAKSIQEVSLKLRDSGPCDADFRVIQRLCMQLTRLKMVVRPIFTKEFFELSFPMLQSLELHFAKVLPIPEACIEATCKFFERHSFRLTEIFIYFAYNVDLYVNGIYKCTQLKRLFSYEYDDIPREGIEKLPNLEELGFGGRLRKLPKQGKVQSLTLEAGTGPDKLYDTLSTDFPNLTELVLGGGLNNRCLWIVSKSLHRLRRWTIAFTHFDKITCKGFRAIGKLQQLEFLKFVGHDTFFSPALDREAIDLLFTNWVLDVHAKELHLQDFSKDCENQLSGIFLENYLIKTLVMDSQVIADRV